MTLREFIKKNLIYNFWSFESDQISAYRLIDNDGYEEYSYEDMISSYRSFSKEKIAFVTYDPHNYTMNIFLED